MISQEQRPIRPPSRPPALLEGIVNAFEARFGALESHLDNPFVTRGVRIDSRRFWSDYQLLLPAAITFVLYAVLFAFWSRSLTMATGVSLGRMLAMVAGGVYGWTVHLVVTSQSKHLLRQESQHNTLEQLLMLPMSRSELVLKLCAYPFLNGIMAALSGIPFLMVAHLLGGLTMAELLGVFLFLAMLSFSPPGWYRPAVSAVEQDNPDRARVEMRKSAEVGCGIYAIVQVGRLLFDLFRGPGSWMLSHLMPLLQGVASNLFYVQGGGYPLLVGMVLTWPLLAGATLAHPIPLYGLPVPPVILALPCYIWLRLASLMVLRERPESDCAAGRAAVLAKGALILAAIGYLWQPAIMAGTLGWLAGGGKPSVVLSQAGLVLLFFGYALISVFFRTQTLRISLDWGNRCESEPAVDLGWVFRPLAGAAIIYVGSHLFGRLNPFSVPAVSMLGRVLLAFMAMLPLALGLRQLRRAVLLRAIRSYVMTRGADAPARNESTKSWRLLKTAAGEAIILEMPVRCRHGAIAVGTGVLLLFLLLPFAYLLWPAEIMWKASVLSPLGSLMSASPASTGFLSSFRGTARPLPPVTSALPLQCSAGAILLAVSAIYMKLAVPKAGRLPSETPCVAWLLSSRLARLPIRWIYRVDNPIVTLVLRQATRNGTATGISIGALIPSLAVAAALGIPDVAILLRSLAEMLFETTMGSTYLGAMLAIGAILLLICILVGSAAKLCIEEEAQASRLPFLMLTPMSMPEITGGIILSRGAPYFAVQMAALPPLLLLAALSWGAGSGGAALALLISLGILIPGTIYLCAWLAIGTSRWATPQKYRAASVIGGCLVAIVYLILAITFFTLPCRGYFAFGLMGVVHALVGMLLRRDALRELAKRRREDMELGGDMISN